MLRAGLCTVHDCVAAVQLKRVIEACQPLGSLTVTAVHDPAIGLHQYSRAQVTVCVPPIGGTRGAAAGAGDECLAKDTVCFCFFDKEVHRKARRQRKTEGPAGTPFFDRRRI